MIPIQPTPKDETQSVEKTLMQYEELLAMREVIKLHIHDARAAVIPPEVAVELENIDNEFASQLEAADQKIEEAKKILQAQVKATGVRVDGRNIQVIYQKPSWKIKDLVKLLQLAIKNPAIMDCLEQSEPVARVQPMKGGK